MFLGKVIVVCGIKGPKRNPCNSCISALSLSLFKDNISLLCCAVSCLFPSFQTNCKIQKSDHGMEKMATVGHSNLYNISQNYNTRSALSRLEPLEQSSWWRQQMETFSALLAICAGNSPVPGEFPTQRPVTRSFDVYFDLHPNKRLSKQWWGWWFETQSCPLWRHRNAKNKG